MSSLDRFSRAQTDPTSGISQVLRELDRGRKVGHWIWYIFPQLVGLGRSPAAVHYGLRGVAEAEDYLRQPDLRRNLLAATEAVARALDAPGRSLADVMGSDIDALKLVSSLTLFQHVARSIDVDAPDAADALNRLAEAADGVLAAAAREGYAECRFTLAALARRGIGRTSR